jgi:hypothetical protein
MAVGPIPEGFASLGDVPVNALQVGDFIEALDEKVAGRYLHGYVVELTPRAANGRIKVTVRPYVGDPVIVSRYASTRVATWRRRDVGDC